MLTTSLFPPLLDSSPAQAPLSLDEALSPLTVSTIHTALLLPPLDEIIEAIQTFCACYFQLGFICGPLFIARLRHNPDSVSPFLLTSLLAISARFTSSLVQRYGSQFHASEHFVNRAMEMVPVEWLTPSLEACQAFFLLAACDWGQGLGQRMLMDIATRMARVLRLHDEATYKLGPHPTRSETIETEMARRTFWIVHLHDNLYTRLNRPGSFFHFEITAFLPFDDEAYLQGLSPATRSSLKDTAAAVRAPETVFRPDRSLFTLMVQVTALWAKVARKACSIDQASVHGPWHCDGEYTTLRLELYQWEGQLPPRHRWSQDNLNHWRDKKQDLAFFVTNATLRLSHMVLYRLQVPLVASLGVYDPQYQNSLAERDLQLALSFVELVDMMAKEAFEAITYADVFFSTRSRSDGYSPFILYIVFVAGDIALYIHKFSILVDSVYTTKAEAMLTKCLDLLRGAVTAWPVAARWHTLLVEAWTNESHDPIGDFPNLFGGISCPSPMFCAPFKRASCDVPAAPSALSCSGNTSSAMGLETEDGNLLQQFTHFSPDEDASPLLSLGSFDCRCLALADPRFLPPPLASAEPPNELPCALAFPLPYHMTSFPALDLMGSELA
ncbi:BQ2448_2810 [Microbotryum intermedium]|uniref:BQ2448_2810 protein n=1 Tax=Microbotryum intermedium TaxID=269621 RepID=A0A238FBJ7_9BASI|nr:BQ2448_2810 [Microbotryum intermedium]